jgi:hypothetical protein
MLPINNCEKWICPYAFQNPGPTDFSKSLPISQVMLQTIRQTLGD